MSALMASESMNFNDLKAMINVTDGNLASHLKTLEENKIVEVKKGFIGRKTNTTYSVTEEGARQFRAHLDALEQIIKGLNK